MITIGYDGSMQFDMVSGAGESKQKVSGGWVCGGLCGGRSRSGGASPSLSTQKNSKSKSTQSQNSIKCPKNKAANKRKAVKRSPNSRKIQASLTYNNDNRLDAKNKEQEKLFLHLGG